MSNLLNIKNLHAAVEEKEILKGLDLEVNKGEIHVIMGPNGGGKSTLANVIMGHPKYEVTEGEMLFEGEDLIEMEPNERAKAGIFLSFQYPEEVEGITVENFLRSSKSAITGENVGFMGFKRLLKSKMELLKIDESYGSRYLNVGFSGGEKKKNEILQMAVLEPKLAILDETDSGLDVDAIRIVAEGVKVFKNSENALIIITHSNKILEYIEPDFVHVIIEGKIAKTGNGSLAREINEKGYEELKNQLIS
ncbi:MAG: Fe-S cluster assembly ATPase SufC [Clostridiaceae bacterium]